jgi:N-acetyl-gamma-glutamylphosphate reductase
LKKKETIKKKWKENVLVAGTNGTTGKLIVELLNKSINILNSNGEKTKSKDSFEKQNIKAVLADLEQEVENAVKKIKKK